MRHILCAILVVALAAPVGAVAPVLGVKAGACGASRSYSRWMQPSETVTRDGFCGGVFLEWEHSRHVSLLTEAQYVEKGLGRDRAHVSYVSFPFLGRFRLPLGPSVRVYAAAGPRLDMLLARDRSDERGDLDYVDFGADLVLGSEIGRVMLEARYCWTPEDTPIPDGGSAKNLEAFMVQVGFRFGRLDEELSEPPN